MRSAFATLSVGGTLERTAQRESVSGSPVPRLLARLASPERLYQSTLGFTGLAAVFTVMLPAAERGVLAAAVASATLGSAVGGISMDTFLLSRPGGWIAARGYRVVLGTLVICVLASAAVASLLTATAALGSYAVSIGGAGALTAGNVSAALAMRRNKFVFVYSARAVAGVVLIGGYVLVFASGNRDGVMWSTVWLGSQCLAALIIGAGVLRWGWPVREQFMTGAKLPVRAEASAMGKLHLSICAQMVTSRLDQILLARFAGGSALGIYALAVAALEFAQAGAVVRSQRILAGQGETHTLVGVKDVVKSWLPVAVLSVLALAALGLVRPEYGQAWLLGLCLLMGGLAVAAGRMWSATLLKRRGERETLIVALLAMVVAIVLCLVLIPWYGAFGAAFATSLAYLTYAALTRASLRHGARTLAETAS